MADTNLNHVATRIVTVTASTDGFGYKAGESVPAISFSHPVDFCMLSPLFLKAVLEAAEKCAVANERAAHVGEVPR